MNCTTAQERFADLLDVRETFLGGEIGRAHV